MPNDGFQWNFIQVLSRYLWDTSGLSSWLIFVSGVREEMIYMALYVIFQLAYLLMMPFCFVLYTI